jgi:hypothetical protein
MIKTLLLTALLPVSLVACGSSSSGDTQPTPAGTHYQYVISSVTAPTGEQSEQIIRVDNNHKPVETGGQLVNALGGLLGTLKSLGNVDVQTPLNTAVNDGAIILLADVQTADFMNTTAAGFEVFIGSNAMPPPCNGSSDTVCGNQLKGTGTFDATANGNMALGGKIINGQFTGGGAGDELQIEFQLSAGSGGGSAAPLMLNLLDAHAQLSTISATGIMTGIVGGAISQDDINNMLIPTVATQIQSQIDSECTGSGSGVAPGCGCPAGSGIASVLSLLDTNPSDCHVTAMEIMTNTTVESLLQPDVVTGSGSAENALSVGIGIAAVAATYTAPSE